MTLPDPTRKRVIVSAEEQRGDMTEEEWRWHVLKVARTQEKILNLVTETAGPEGMEFRVQCREPGGEWRHCGDGISDDG